MIEVKNKVLGVAVVFMTIAILVSPVLAIGPTSVPEDKNPNLELAPPNTQIWLPSGIMNEWIITPAAGELKVTLKDAAKFQISKAIPISIPADILTFFANENQWFYWTQDDFRAFLFGGGYDSAIADNYEAGVYIKMNFVG